MNERGYAAILIADIDGARWPAGPLDFTAARELGLDGALIGYSNRRMILDLGFDGDLVPQTTQPEMLAIINETLMRLTKAGILPETLWDPVAIIWHDGDQVDPSPADTAIDDQIGAAIDERLKRRDP